MNRYVAEGVADDIVSGRHVVVVVSDVRGALDKVCDKLQGININVRLARGKEEISSRSGGWAKFISTRSSAAGRGMTADVLVLDEPMSAEMRAYLYPIAMRGEVIE